MLMRYAGKVVNGQPTLLEVVKLPENADITIIIDLPKPETVTQTVSEEELKKRREIAKSLRGIIPSDVDVEALRAERIAKRGLLE